MKKYFVGILFVAALAVIGGINFGNTNIAHAAVTCHNDTECVGQCTTTNASGSTVTYNGFCNGGNTCTCGYGIVGNTSGGANVSGVSGFVNPNPVITWTPSLGATSYNLQVSESPTFSTLVVNRAVVGNSSRVFPPGNSTVPNSGNGGAPTMDRNEGCFVPSGCGTSIAATPCTWQSPCSASVVGGGTTGVTASLKANTKYYFRIQAVNPFGTSAWSNTFTFTTNGASASIVPGYCQLHPEDPMCGVNGVAAGVSIVAPSADSLFSNLINAGASWINLNGAKVNPTKITTKTTYYTENNVQVFPANSAAQSLASMIDNVIAGRSDGNNGGSTQRALPCGTIFGVIQPGGTFASGSYTCTCVSGPNVSCSASAVHSTGTTTQ